MKPDYDTTVARIAGNIMPALIAMHGLTSKKSLSKLAVMMARSIVDEVKRAQPEPEKLHVYPMVEVRWLDKDPEKTT